MSGKEKSKLAMAVGGAAFIALALLLARTGVPERAPDLGFSTEGDQQVQLAALVPAVAGATASSSAPATSAEQQADAGAKATIEAFLAQAAADPRYYAEAAGVVQDCLMQEASARRGDRAELFGRPPGEDVWAAIRTKCRDLPWKYRSERYEWLAKAATAGVPGSAAMILIAGPAWGDGVSDPSADPRLEAWRADALDLITKAAAKGAKDAVMLLATNVYVSDGVGGNDVVKRTAYLLVAKELGYGKGLPDVAAGKDLPGYQPANDQERKAATELAAEILRRMGRR